MKYTKYCLCAALYWCMYNTSADSAKSEDATAIAISQNAEAAEVRSQSQLEQRALATFGVKIETLSQQLAEVLGKLEVIERQLQEIKPPLAVTNAVKAPVETANAPAKTLGEETSAASQTTPVASTEGHDAPQESPSVETPQPTEEDKLKAELAALSPEEAYQKARSFISAGDYDKATFALNTFIDLHPTHDLVQAALYWLGETFYIRKQYAEAAKKFAESYQKNDKGSKTADALMKLAMSLARLEKKQEACTTLKKLKTDFPNLSKAQQTIVDKERQAASCK